MAKFKGKLSLSTINSLKGFLDFYTIGDYTIVRTWPKNNGLSQTPASIPWQRVFAFFMECMGAHPVAGPIYIPNSVTGKEWASRDYLMSTYYGKMQVPTGWIYDQRDPWPPPIPDPHDRLFITTHPVGRPRLGGRITLHWQRCPAGSNTIIFITDPPLIYRKTFNRRRQKHMTITTYTPSSPSYGPLVCHQETPGSQLMTVSFIPPTDKPLYFFFVSTLTSPQRYLSTSPWFVLKYKPLPGPIPWPGNLEGPVILEPRHILYPDRPVDVFA